MTQGIPRKSQSKRFYGRRPGGPQPRQDNGAPEGAPIDGGDGTDGVVRLFGIHPIEAALANPARVIRKLYVTENAENRMRAAIVARGIVPQSVTPRELDRWLGADTVHQGALLETEELEEESLVDLAGKARGRPLVVLDQVTDPHNVGAIMRSAAVFGAAGMVMTRRHSPPLTGTLAKSASGALELVPVARVTNLAQGLSALIEEGCTVIGLDGEGEQVLHDIKWPDQPVFVLGAEGKGLRHLTRETCSVICRISTESMLASLNVSNAAAVALHMALLRRQGVLGQVQS